MRILFVHQNFPAQYKAVAPALARLGHDVQVLTDSVNQRPFDLPAHRYQFAPKPIVEPSHLASQFISHIGRAEVVGRAAAELKRQGYRPDVISGHLGWGETLMLKDVWPDAKLIVYAEFFYQPTGADVGFDKEFPTPEFESRSRVTARQASLLLAMNSADRAQAPTAWQASTFPAELRSKISIVHEGIETGQCVPWAGASVRVRNGTITLKPGDEVITFVNRNLEPYRGYHVFIRALPKVLAARPNARAIIVGGNEVSYGASPGPGRTWREIFLAEVRDRLDMSRVHFVGKIPYNVFINLMQVSAVHPYLTYPFVLSWSMLEAMSAGALVLGSRTPPVEEVIRDGENGRLIDFFDVEAWSDAIIEALAEPARFRAMREAARRTIIERYDLQSVCLPRQIELVESTGGLVRDRAAA